MTVYAVHTVVNQLFHQLQQDNINQRNYDAPIGNFSND